MMVMLAVYQGKFLMNKGLNTVRCWNFFKFSEISTLFFSLDRSIQMLTFFSFLIDRVDERKITFSHFVGYFLAVNQSFLG